MYFTLYVLRIKLHYKYTLCNFGGFVHLIVAFFKKKKITISFLNIGFVILYGIYQTLTDVES